MPKSGALVRESSERTSTHEPNGSICTILSATTAGLGDIDISAAEEGVVVPEIWRVPLFSCAASLSSVLTDCVIPETLEGALPVCTLADGTETLPVFSRFSSRSILEMRSACSTRKDGVQSFIMQSSMSNRLSVLRPILSRVSRISESAESTAESGKVFACSRVRLSSSGISESIRLGFFIVCISIISRKWLHSSFKSTCKSFAA